MSTSVPVSIHPYFKARAGNMEAVRALLRRFVEKAATESGCLGYDFTINGSEVACREWYVDAAATLAHIQNVGPELDEMLVLCDLARLELHGPSAELDQLRGPLGGLNPAWFIFECGVER